LEVVCFEIGLMRFEKYVGVEKRMKSPLAVIPGKGALS
jgi:hypothetical protein